MTKSPEKLRNMGQQETAIYQVLRKAQADGTLSQTQDARALARFFLGVAWGINAMNKSVADPGVFRDMVRVAMTAWETPGVAQRKGSRLTAHGRPNDSDRFDRSKVPAGGRGSHSSK